MDEDLKFWKGNIAAITGFISKELLDFVTWCDKILNLLLWINDSIWRRLKNHGPVKFNFKLILFYSPKSENDQKYEYFVLLWSMISLDLWESSSEQHAALSKSDIFLTKRRSQEVKLQGIKHLVTKFLKSNATAQGLLNWI